MKKHLLIILSFVVLASCASRQTITPTSELVTIDGQPWCVVEPFISFPVLGVWQGAEADKGRTSEKDPMAGMIRHGVNGRYLIAVSSPADEEPKIMLNGFNNHYEASMQGLWDAVSPGGEVVDLRTLRNGALLAYLIYPSNEQTVDFKAISSDKKTYFLATFYGSGPEADAYASDFIRMMEQARIH